MARCASAIRPLPWMVQILISAALAVAAAGTAFRREMAWQFVLVGACVALAGTLILKMRQHRSLPRVVWRLGAGVALLAIGVMVYVDWHAYIQRYRASGTYLAWSDPSVYGRQ